MDTIDSAIAWITDDDNARYDSYRQVADICEMLFPMLKLPWGMEDIVAEHRDQIEAELIKMRLRDG